VSPLYLYAVLGAAPARPLGIGLRDEPLHLVPCEGVVAVAGDVDGAPALTPDTLRGHDAVVRRLAEIADAILPARFGAVAADAHDLCGRLTGAGGALRDALARVAGREQMILRIYRASPARPPAASQGELPSPAEGPGARYLAERARAQRTAAAADELAPIRPVLDRFVTAERVERHQTPPLVASVYHLLARGSAPAYAAAVERAARDLPELRITVSGPWAPYAFAPESLG
jgi:hypothetical protein